MKLFLQTNSMLTTARLTYPVFSPYFGWAIFGGWDNPTTKVQALSGIDDTWRNVTDLYLSSGIVEHCTMQVPILPTHYQHTIPTLQMQHTFNSFHTLLGLITSKEDENLWFYRDLGKTKFGFNMCAVQS